MTGARETAEQLDSAIDTLLHDPAGPRPAVEGELSATARLLRDALPRLHPRFSFEEHLAARLAAARRYAAGEAPAPAAPTPPPTPIGPRLATVVAAGDDVPEDEVAEHRRLGLVAGGAIASGVSLAGAALVVWRRSRSSGGMF